MQICQSAQNLQKVHRRVYSSATHTPHQDNSFLYYQAQSSESAIIEDVTMVIPGISNPHESTIAGKGAVIEVGWTSSQNRIPSSIYDAVEPVG